MKNLAPFSEKSEKLYVFIGKKLQKWEGNDAMMLCRLTASRNARVLNKSDYFLALPVPYNILAVIDTTLVRFLML